MNAKVRAVHLDAKFFVPCVFILGCGDVAQIMHALQNILLASLGPLGINDGIVG